MGTGVILVMTTNNDLQNELAYIKQVLFTHIDNMDGRAHMRAGNGHDGFMNSQQVDYISGQITTTRIPTNSDLLQLAQGRYYGALTDLKVEDRPIGFPTSSFVLDAIGKPGDTRILVLSSQGSGKQYIKVAKAGSGVSEWRENSVRLRLFRGSFSPTQNGKITFAQEIPQLNNVLEFTSFVIWGFSPSGSFSITTIPGNGIQQRVTTVGIDKNNGNQIAANKLFFTITNESFTVDDAYGRVGEIVYEDPYEGWVIKGIDAIQ